MEELKARVLAVLQRVPLTSLQFNILESLVEHRGKVVPREELRDAVWTHHDDICLPPLTVTSPRFERSSNRKMKIS